MAQALVRRRFGLRRFPVVTAVVFGVTAATSVLGLVDAEVLAALQRAPEGLHGDWWRTFTSLLVQDGGVPGTLSNLFFLLVMGVLAEQVAGRWRWLVAYLGAGLAGELAGYAWQPRGAGNSVAVCGLAGMLVVALAVGGRTPRLAPWRCCGGAGRCWRRAGGPCRWWGSSPGPSPSSWLRRGGRSPPAAWRPRPPRSWPWCWSRPPTSTVRPWPPAS